MSYPSKTTPEAILEAATQILEQGGPDSLSMRSLAQALGIKAPSLYRYFTDRAALEGALADQGALQLRDRMSEVGGSDARERLREAAYAYLNFARSSPLMYTLMLAPCPPDRPPAITEAGKALWNKVLALIEPLSGNPDDTAAAVAFWSFLHGFITLERTGQFGPTGPHQGFEVGLEGLITEFTRANPVTPSR